MSGALIDGHDAALFDLDGVVYLGPHPVPAAPDTIAELRRRGVKVGFVTNNAARSAEVVAQHLTDIGIPTEASDVVTSAQAITDLAAEQLSAGAKVLIIGTESLRVEARSRGLVTVESAQDDPVAVIQGYDPHIDWSLLEEAGFALQAGAKWYAANPDITRPTDRGIVPGIGAQLQDLGLGKARVQGIGGAEHLDRGPGGDAMLAAGLQHGGADHVDAIAARHDIQRNARMHKKAGC